ncbi:Sodium/potassium-transporting atpase subunit alpha [Globisporangium polare]
MDDAPPSTPKQAFVRMEDAYPTAAEPSASLQQRVPSRRSSVRSSAEIIAATTEMRQRIESRKQARRANKSKQTAEGSSGVALTPAESADEAKRELVMTEHKMGIAELAAELLTDLEHGMNVDNVDMRRETEGLNQLTPPKKVPEWLKYWHELTGFFCLLLWAGSLMCFVSYAIQYSTDNLYLGIILAFVVLITGSFSYVQNYNSNNLMESFKNMMPTMITVIREGKSQKIDASLLVRGDLVVIKGGDKVPADVRIIECSDDLTVDNSSLTGEPEPLKRIPHCTDENPLETKNLCFFGTFIPQGSGKGIVVNIGDKTVMGRIARLATSTVVDQTPIAKEIDHFVHVIALVATIIGLFFFVIGFVIGTDFVSNLVFMIGVIVANVPEGLLATVTVCLSLAAKRMAAKNMLVKNLQGVETLGSTTCICSDKTGTLTQNVMTVANVVYDNKIWDAECSITPVGSYSLSDVSYQRLQRCATLCNNAVFDEESKYEKVITGSGESLNISRGASLPIRSADGKINWETIGDASESAMIKFCQDKKDVVEYRAENLKIKEIPFNSKNKYQVSIHKQQNDDSKPLVLVMKGAPERIIARCQTIMMDGEEVPLTPERLVEIEHLQLELSKRGMRVLGFAEKVLDPVKYPVDYKFNTDIPNFPLGEKDLDYTAIPMPDPNCEEPLCFLGLMSLIDPPRAEVPDAVEKCKTAGIRVIMVTGDHPVTAKAIAHKVGILWGPTCEDIEEGNASRGLVPGSPGYEDPATAPAIVVPGWSISMDTPQEEWDRILDHAQIVFARTSPQQKLVIVENCQRRKEIVAVTGDGVNDSPALKKADIGVAMGIMGSEVSKEAADMILLDDNFASIVSGVEEGRIIFDNLKKSIAYALAANIPELVPFLLNIVLRIPLPLTTVLMLAICLGTDMVPAISMAYETAENDIMARAPRNAAVDRLVTKKLISFAYLQIGIIEAAAGMFTYLTVMNDFGYPPSVLPGLGMGTSFGRQVMWCKTTGGEFCTPGGRHKNGQGLWTSLGLSEEQVCESEFNATIPTGGSIYDARIFWSPNHNGKVNDCQYALANFKGSNSKPSGFNRLKIGTYGDYTASTDVVTLQAMEAAWSAGYRPYYPMRARRSHFFNMYWLRWDVSDKNAEGFDPKLVDDVFMSYQPLGVFGITNSANTKNSVKAPGSAKKAFRDAEVNVLALNGSVSATQSFTLSQAVYREAVHVAVTSSATGIPACTGDACLLDYRAGFTSEDNGSTYSNIMSRMMQAKALAVTQTAYFVAIIVSQWANLIVCRTRMLSNVDQGMNNSVLNMGIVFETIVGVAFCYAGFLQGVFRTDSIRLTHWFCAMPFSLFIFAYDETRKFILRKTSRSYVDKKTGRIFRAKGWLEENTYY